MIPNEKAVLKELEKAYSSIVLAQRIMGKEPIMSAVELVRTAERENMIYRYLNFVERDLNFAISLIKDGTERDFAIEAAIAKMEYNLFDEGE